MMSNQDTEKSYLVTGIHPVFGHKSGERFTRDIPSAQEAALVQGGAIKRVVEPTSGTDEKPMRPPRNPMKPGH